MEIKRFPESGFGCNSYLLCEEEGDKCLLIDPGNSGEEILSYLKRKQLELEYIIDTHGHVDHILHNGQIKEATGALLLIHEQDAPMLIDSSKNLSMYMAAMGGKVEGPPADQLLQEGELLQLGQLSLKVIHTPGHTPGGISILVEDSHLFSGDTVFAQGVGRTDFPGGSMTKLMDSIRERLLVLPEEITVYPGHGPQATIGEIRQGNPMV